MLSEFEDDARRDRWDLSFLVDAMVVARRSKDPSTKVGAVIVRPDLTKASEGYNGFPRGIADTQERLTTREIKYDLVVHAETNALLTAKEPLKGYTMYTTFPPCIRCAGSIIQAGISRIVSIKPTAEQEERWGFHRTRELFAEAGIPIVEFEASRVSVSAALSGLSFVQWGHQAEGHQGCSCAA